MEFYTNMTKIVESMKEQEPDRIAYRYFRAGKEEYITYKKLTEKIEDISYEMHKKFGERNTIALFGETTYQWMTVYLGILTSNNIVVTLDNKLLPEQKEAIIKEMNVTYVFEDSLTKEQQKDIYKNCNSVKEIYNIIEYVEKERETEVLEEISFDVDAVAHYMFTSGSSGKSKAVMLSYKNLASIAKVQNIQLFQKQDVMLSALPIHHCFELSTQISQLCCGCTICINDSLDNLVKNMRYFEPTMMCLVPAQLEEVLRNFNLWVKQTGIDVKHKAMTKEQRELFVSTFGSRLKCFYSGGAAVRLELAKELDYYGIKLITGFGMTEMCGHICMNPKLLEKPSSVGIPFRDDVIVKFAEDGEILIKGPNLMLGYYNMERGEFFTEDGFLKTGDLGRKDEEGYLYIVGRKKNVILLSNGENVYPEELEALLGNIEGVRQVAVFEWENQIATLLYLEESVSQQVIEEDIRNLNEKLASYKRITRVFYRDTPFPKTASSKIDKIRLIKEFKESNQTEFVPLETEAEKNVAKAIADILNCDKEIGAMDNFFALGGNSLLALAIAAELGINAQTIYENPRIRDLAEVIEEEETAEVQDESYVNDLIQNANHMVNEKPIRNILLTGATGFLGAHVLSELVYKTDANIYCMIRSESKMELVYKTYFTETLPEKVTLVKGELTKDYLGMEADVYEELIKKIDTVIHVAANVHHVGDKEVFMNTNYMGTRRIIQFSKQANAVLHYVSSYVSSGIAVVPIYSDVTEFTEQVLYIGQDYKQNIYVHTKYLSEVEILKERENGLKANIYRIGCLTSRRRDGVFQMNAGENGLQKRLRGLLKIGMIMDTTEESPIDLTAVDECADAFVRLIVAGNLNQIYHMFNPNTITMKEIGGYYNKTIKSVPKEEFRNTVNQHLDDEEIATLSFYTERLAASKPIHMDNAITIDTLKKLNFTWSKPTEEYLKSFIN